MNIGQESGGGIWKRNIYTAGETMEEKYWRRNHGEGIMEEKTWRRNH